VYEIKILAHFIFLLSRASWPVERCATLAFFGVIFPLSRAFLRVSRCGKLAFSVSDS